MQVFKFGGASVKDAAAVQNVVNIIEHFPNEELVIVVSAMGKTTNALEEVIAAYWKKDTSELAEKINSLRGFHDVILDELFPNNHDGIKEEIAEIFDGLVEECNEPCSDNYHFEYDQIVSLGEVISTKIVNTFLNKNGVASTWLDARKMVRTNNSWREGKVNWEETTKKVKEQVDKTDTRISVTQGFLGHTAEGFTTTLGREGSDFTAAIMAYSLGAESVTIWKDVPGMLNADPKWFDNTVLLEKISFKEAIELAYYGASVIHPKTIQPLKKMNIPLYVKSFINPDQQGTVIQESSVNDSIIPSFIFKMDQVLISLSPKDLSFIIEENLEEIFGYLSKENIRMNLLQTSAVSFSFVVDRAKVDLEKLVANFEDDYLVRYNEGLEIVTIRHFDEPTIKRVTKYKKIILEQKTRETVRIVMKDLGV
ncbi:MAG: aspartate kinase [Crocinitomicaceae bacterium]|nr:aspartate kinase [Crocinitomicaceae bacterium]